MLATPDLIGLNGVVSRAPLCSMEVPGAGDTCFLSKLKQLLNLRLDDS